MKIMYLEIRQQLMNRSKDKLISMRKPCRHMQYYFDNKNQYHPVDVSKLTEIIEINTDDNTATVEGSVTLGQLCKATLTHHRMPAVVPELRSLLWLD